MRITLALLASLLLLAVGCATDHKAPLLSTRAELAVNVGQTVRVVGKAHYSRIPGPSVAGEDFELRVYPRSVWDADTDGKKVEVTGKLNDARRTTPPDPSVLPGEYWIDEATWIPAEDAEKKK